HADDPAHPRPRAAAGEPYARAVEAAEVLLVEEPAQDLRSRELEELARGHRAQEAGHALPEVAVVVPPRAAPLLRQPLDQDARRPARVRGQAEARLELLGAGHVALEHVARGQPLQGHDALVRRAARPGVDGEDAAPAA